ncbi:MAG: cytochrome c biogenesis protein [Planctomycetota bacterium]
MRVHAVTLTVLLVGAMPLCCNAKERGTFDWDQWRHLPVQEGGRHKPLDTLSWETFRMLSNQTSFKDSESRQTLDANTLYLVLLFDWQGWEQPENPHFSAGVQSRRVYFQVHKPDKWDRAPLIRVNFLELREALDMPRDGKTISPLDLSQARIREPRSGEERPFLRWAQELIGKEQEGLTRFEKKALELADKFWSYQDHRMGRRLRIFPTQHTREDEWMSVASLMNTTFDDKNDPTGMIRRVKGQFQKVRNAYLTGAAKPFNTASASFIATLRKLGPRLGAYPSSSDMDLEVAYNRWVPFRFSWIFMSVAFVGMLLSMGTGWKPFYIGGWLAFAAALVAMISGFTLRVMISGRAPVTNMYESVVYLGLGVAIFGLIFESIYRTKYSLTAAAALATLALILADNCPVVLDSSLRPLQPVLRSNFWLVTHVMTITLSYAAFALALGIGNITLGYYLFGASNQQTIDSLTRFNYRAIQVGVLLLAAGTILGGVWADYSWGRFWGWDPKEVWALIALLGYLAVLHARYAGWVKHLGLAVLSVLCFSLIVMAWYGVNFVLGAGLHSYGFGGGGQGWVFGGMALQMLYVVLAALKSTQRGSVVHGESLPAATARSLPSQ